MSFVVAFNGARDAYQVPLALYEQSLLTKLATDFYTPAVGAVIGQYIPAFKKLRSRYADGLPFWKVQSNARLLKLQYLDPILARLEIHSHLGVNPHEKNQALLSLAALDIANKTASNLFLYAGYAYEAFRSPLSSGMVKGVFQYHPHITLSAKILRNDLELYPELTSALVRLQEDEKDSTNIYELMEADFVICASSFSARSIEYVGVSRSKIHIIPYGINFDVNEHHIPEQFTQTEVCHFLFIGSGIHRKGLHHLFEVWNKLKISDAHLTVVARTIDPNIACLTPQTNVNILTSQSPTALQELYKRSHVFVLPSLIEGFGYVYLDALSYGCYCIGTENTGFPDIGCPDYAGGIAIAGNIESLADAIIQAYKMFKKGSLNRLEIRKFASTKKWEKFRISVANVSRKQEFMKT